MKPADIRIPPRQLARGQASSVCVHALGTSTTVEVLRTADLLLEAPNWVGDDLLLNGAGRLWLVSTVSATPAARSVHVTDVPDVNNDHVVASDGDTVYLSAHDWHLYRASLRGGSAVRLTRDDPAQPLMHFLHGLSPDGQELAFIGIEPDESGTWARANVFTMPAVGGPLRQLTFGSRPADGCEYSPDGEWIYFNTEAFSETAGHAQLARVRPDGAELTQLTFDDRVNWFPHLSPDGTQLVYVSFEPGTQGHPADKWVELKCAPVDSCADANTVARVFGGQGTLNVNSWAADSQRFAFVAYPEAEAEEAHSL